jgi:hypothetical protein
MNSEQIEDTCFPFDSNEEISPISPLQLNEEEENNNECSKLFKMKFKIRKYFLNEQGRRRREKKARKYKPDDIRKKIKVKFHKTLKLIINNNLKTAGSRKFFKYFPQSFIGNITQKFNLKYLDYTFKELLLTDFSLSHDESRYKRADYKNYLTNKNTVKYLEENNLISINSGFDFIKDMKYKDIFRSYLSSKHFKNSIKELQTKNEDSYYIQEYIRLSKNYLEYFSGTDTTGDEDEINDEINNYLLTDEFDKFRNNFGI